MHVIVSVRSAIVGALQGLSQVMVPMPRALRAPSSRAQTRHRAPSCARR